MYTEIRDNRYDILVVTTLILCIEMFNSGWNFLVDVWIRFPFKGKYV